MAKKLKCWKEESPDRAHGVMREWNNKEDTILMGRIDVPKQYVIQLPTKKQHVFRSKQKAIKFAKSYMRKYDKC